MPFINLQFAGRIVSEETKSALSRIRNNMEVNDQIVTGKTAKSLRDEQDISGNTISSTIYGSPIVKLLESGISPEESKKHSWSSVWGGLYRWYENKIGISDMQLRSSLATVATENQRELGSLLYRRGGRKDVYSNEAESLTASIKQRIGDYIYSIKIFE